MSLHTLMGACAGRRLWHAVALGVKNECTPAPGECTPVEAAVRGVENELRGMEKGRGGIERRERAPRTLAPAVRRALPHDTSDARTLRKTLSLAAAHPRLAQYRPLFAKHARSPVTHYTVWSPTLAGCQPQPASRNTVHTAHAHGGALQAHWAITFSCWGAALRTWRRLGRLQRPRRGRAVGVYVHCRRRKAGSMQQAQVASGVCNRLRAAHVLGERASGVHNRLRAHWGLEQRVLVLQTVGGRQRGRQAACSGAGRDGAGKEGEWMRKWRDACDHAVQTKAAASTAGRHST
ncbi:hypothetical protein GGX14DRAFT_637036 [Mycena pura]|uniref:Uncharacterized protein n=1 Tax=Mycena pura TaxID=153505 RepID=A0AAD6Y895_9AGAR|nr:hypothetical protein GGX14DRAFT_637036 [Mycena pura]